VLTIKTTKNHKILYEIRGEVFTPSPNTSIITIEQDFLPETIHYICYENNCPCGCASLVYQELDNTPSHRIRAMAVKPSFQHKGIGRSLLSKCVNEWYLNKLTNSLWLSSLDNAIKFYEKYGFKKQGSPYFREYDGLSQIMIIKK
jgi:predicted GNAT family N-acyltransferase